MKVKTAIASVPISWNSKRVSKERPQEVLIRRPCRHLGEDLVWRISHLLSKRREDRERPRAVKWPSEVMCKTNRCTKPELHTVTSKPCALRTQPWLSWGWWGIKASYLEIKPKQFQNRGLRVLLAELLTCPFTVSLSDHSRSRSLGGRDSGEATFFFFHFVIHSNKASWVPLLKSERLWQSVSDTGCGSFHYMPLHCFLL